MRPSFLQDQIRSSLRVGPYRLYRGTHLNASYFLYYNITISLYIIYNKPAQTCTRCYRRTRRCCDPRRLLLPPSWAAAEAAAAAAERRDSAAVAVPPMSRCCKRARPLVPSRPQRIIADYGTGDDIIKSKRCRSFHTDRAFGDGPSSSCCNDVNARVSET